MMPFSAEVLSPRGPRKAGQSSPFSVPGALSAARVVTVAEQPANSKLHTNNKPRMGDILNSWRTTATAFSLSEKFTEESENPAQLLCRSAQPQPHTLSN